MTENGPGGDPMDQAPFMALVTALGPLLGIDVRPQWRDAVVEHLRQDLEFAAFVLAFPLAPEFEPAPGFDP